MEQAHGATLERSRGTPAMPFDNNRLDALLDEAGIDAALISSKHNIQYLLGGYRFFFFDHFDAIGISRYLPILVYVKGRPDLCAYIGHPMESYERDLGKFWMSSQPAARASLDAAQLAADHLAKIGLPLKRVGVERAFLPTDAHDLLRRTLSQVELVETHMPLERLRARKTPQELEYLRKASELVVELDADGDGRARTGSHQARADRGAPSRGSQPRPHVRILPDHRRDEPQSRAVGTSLGRGRHSLARIRAATTRAISATSAAWRSTASPTPNS